MRGCDGKIESVVYSDSKTNYFSSVCFPIYDHPNITLLFLLYFLLAYLDEVLWVWKILWMSKILKLLLELYNCIAVRASVVLLSGYVDKSQSVLIRITGIITITRGPFHAPQCSYASYIQAEQKCTPWTTKPTYTFIYKNKRECEAGQVILLFFH